MLPSEKFFWVPQSEGLVVTPQKWPEFAAGFTALHIRQFSKKVQTVKYVNQLMNNCTLYKTMMKCTNLAITLQQFIFLVFVSIQQKLATMIDLIQS